MRHNYEKKCRETVMLMYGTYTSAESITSNIVPSPVLDESFEHKKQITVILKQWMETYPPDFVVIDPAHPLLENYLTNTIVKWDNVQKCPLRTK